MAEIYPTNQNRRRAVRLIAFGANPSTDLEICFIDFERNFCGNKHNDIEPIKIDRKTAAFGAFPSTDLKI